MAQAINNRGQVVGASWQRDDAGNQIHRAFLWERGNMTGLGTLGGAKSFAFGINSRGQVVGRSKTADSQTHPFLWRRGRMTNLWPSSNGEALGINDHGQVVGYHYVGEDQHAFLWEEGVLTDLQTLGGQNSNALGINNHGQVVGWSDTAEGERHAFFQERGQAMMDLGTLGGGDSSAAAISDENLVVGSSNLTDAWWWNGRSAFIWKDGEMTPIGPLDYAADSGANAINNRREVVGCSPDSDPQRGYRWSNGMMIGLEPVNASDSWWIANGINDRGQIVGQSGGNAALWTPVIG